MTELEMEDGLPNANFRGLTTPFPWLHTGHSGKLSSLAVRNKDNCWHFPHPTSECWPNARIHRLQSGQTSPGQPCGSQAKGRLAASLTLLVGNQGYSGDLHGPVPRKQVLEQWGWGAVDFLLLRREQAAILQGTGRRKMAWPTNNWKFPPVYYLALTPLLRRKLRF